MAVFTLAAEFPIVAKAGGREIAFMYLVAMRTAYPYELARRD